MRDPYSVLGVKRNADADEIKAAWRTKAKSVHPDHNLDDPSATGRFAEVGQAYDLLKDPDKRRRYDKAADMHQTIMQQREAARQAEERAKAARANAEKVMEELARANAQRAQNQSQAQAKAQAQAKPKAATQTQTNNADEPPVEDAEDMIERIFGSGDDATDAAREKAAAQAKAHAQQQAQQQAQAQAAKARADAATDTKAEAGFENAAAADDSAAKTDAAPRQPLPMQAVELVAALVRRWRGAPPEKAPDMTAEVIVTLDDLIAQNTVPMHLADERDVKLPLEAGMTDGHVVRMKGQGIKMPSPIARGDLVVTVRVARHERFRLEGFDLHTVLAISLEDAVLGTETEVETPGGKVPITVPAWSGSDRSITLDGLGLADGDGGRGALVVELRVVLWEKPDEKVTDLMKHMRHGLYV